MERKFFYFGIKNFFVAPVRVLMDRVFISLTEIEEILGPQLVAEIRNDAVMLKSSQSKFRLVGDSFFFDHKENQIFFSHTEASFLQYCKVFTKTDVVLERPGKCSKDFDSHHSLLPFFWDNHTLLTNYKEMQSAPTDLKKLEEALSKSTGGTKYDPIDKDKNCNDYSENDWTKRLVLGIKECQDDNIVLYSSVLRGQKFPQLLKYMKVDEDYEMAVVFRGSPDLVLRKNHTVCIAPSGGSSEEISSDDSGDGMSLENTHQTHSLKSKVCGLPEKLGELMAIQHSILVLKVIRRIVQGKDLSGKKITAYGLLVSKIFGTVKVVSSVQLTQLSQLSKIEFSIHNCFGEALNPQVLCHFFKTLKG